MKFLCLGVILALAVTLASAISVSQLIKDEWELFKKTHDKSYSEFEDKFRLKVYLENRHKIARHNTRNQFGDVSYTLAMNKYGDLVSSFNFSVWEYMEYIFCSPLASS